MTDLKTLLLNTLHGVSEGFDNALGDLQEMVSQADAAVKAMSPDATVSLRKLESDENGTTYAIRVTGGQSAQDAQYYKVNTSGYPIRSASSKSSLEAGLSTPLPTKSVLEKHFADMAKDQNSGLVGAIAWVLRK